MKRTAIFLGVAATLVAVAGLTTTRPWVPVVHAAGTLFEASLQSGDYGGGQVENTKTPDHGGSPGVVGIVASPDGVTFTPTAVSGKSNAVLSWALDSVSAAPLRSSGTISFCFSADRADHFVGWLWGDNYGWDQFNNGQQTIGASASRIENGPGTADDEV